MVGPTERWLLHTYVLDIINERFLSCTFQFLFQVVHLEVYVPDPKDFQNFRNLKFENENIEIVRQPSYDQSRKAAVGDKITLSCVAVCKHTLVYEWLKQVNIKL